jgi:hypothetical protein
MVTGGGAGRATTRWTTVSATAIRRPGFGPTQFRTLREGPRGVVALQLLKLCSVQPVVRQVIPGANGYGHGPYGVEPDGSHTSPQVRLKTGLILSG